MNENDEFNRETVSMDIDRDEVVMDVVTEENVEWNELMKSEGFTSKPQKPKDFERLLVGSPNSSIIWIQYIAFYLTKKNTVKARSIIERAFQEINVSEDKERLNIWIAWMNLEVLYGTEDTLIRVFKKALRSNDQKDVYIQVVGVCQQNKKYRLCNKYYTEMVHKFRTDSSVYINYGQFLYQRFVKLLNHGYLDQARDLLKRAIQNLKLKSQHISIIQKFAWFEYKYINKLIINPRRSHEINNMNIKNEGKSMFEGLLKKYYKKPNIWKTYALCVYKFGAITNNRVQLARDIFERGVSQQSMKVQDTKWLFKQYLSFESQYGYRSPDHEENVAHIKELAKKYVSSIQKKRQNQ